MILAAGLLVFSAVFVIAWVANRSRYDSGIRSNLIWVPDRGWMTHEQAEAVRLGWE